MGKLTGASKIYNPKQDARRLCPVCRAYIKLNKDCMTCFMQKRLKEKRNNT